MPFKRRYLVEHHDDLEAWAQVEGVGYKQVKETVERGLKRLKKDMAVVDPYQPVTLTLANLGKQVPLQPICFAKGPRGLPGVHQLEMVMNGRHMAVIYVGGDFYFNAEEQARFLDYTLNEPEHRIAERHIPEQYRFHLVTLLTNLGITNNKAQPYIEAYGANTWFTSRAGFNHWLVASAKPAAQAVLRLALEQYQAQQLVNMRLAVADMDRAYVQPRVDAIACNHALNQHLGVFPSISRRLNQALFPGAPTRKELFAATGMPDLAQAHQAVPAVLKGSTMTMYKLARELLVEELAASPCMSKQERKELVAGAEDMCSTYADVKNRQGNATLSDFVLTDAEHVRTRQRTIKALVKTGACVPSQEVMASIRILNNGAAAVANAPAVEAVAQQQQQL